MKRSELKDGQAFHYDGYPSATLRADGANDLAISAESEETWGRSSFWNKNGGVFLVAESPADPVSPDYYAGLTPEPIEVIRAWGLDVGPDADHYRASAIPYIARAGKKGGEDKYVEDLRKAVRFLTWAIEAREAKQEPPF